MKEHQPPMNPYGGRIYNFSDQKKNLCNNLAMKQTNSGMAQTTKFPAATYKD